MVQAEECWVGGGMSAQLENGFTRIADEILEVVPTFKFNGTQLRIIMIVWRYTYGFSRKDHEMSLTFFSKATGLGKTQIDREIKNLIEANVLIVTEESTYTKSRKLAFNKHYDRWNIESSDSKQKIVLSAKTLTASKNADEQSANSLTPTVSKNADQDIHSFINNSINNTTTPPEILIQDEYANLHKKLAINLRQSEIMCINRLLTEQIPPDFIIDSMKTIHKEKTSTGEEINSFTYYEKGIKRMFRESNNPVITIGQHKKSNNMDWDYIKKKLEEAEREIGTGA